MFDSVNSIAFGREWEAAWNRRDVEAILKHFHDDVVFTSPVVKQIGFAEDGTVNGKDALRRYWFRIRTTGHGRSLSAVRTPFDEAETAMRMVRHGLLAPNIPQADSTEGARWMVTWQVAPTLTERRSVGSPMRGIPYSRPPVRAPRSPHSRPQERSAADDCKTGVIPFRST